MLAQRYSGFVVGFLFYTHLKLGASFALPCVLFLQPALQLS